MPDQKNAKASDLLRLLACIDDNGNQVPLGVRTGCHVRRYQYAQIQCSTGQRAKATAATVHAGCGCGCGWVGFRWAFGIDFDNEEHEFKQRAFAFTFRIYVKHRMARYTDTGIEHLSTNQRLVGSQIPKVGKFKCLESVCWSV